MKFGFHLPISGGFSKLRREAERLTCEAVQIFVKNPRSWKKKIWKKEEIEAFRSIREDFIVFAHLSYLPNPAIAFWDKKHMEDIEEQIELCLQIGISHLVIHPGSKREHEVGIENIATALNSLLATYEIKILLENTAGGGNKIGGNLEELISIRNRVMKKERLFFCLDTAHLFQAGYDIRKSETWREVKQMLGIEKIGLVHLNDSKTRLGSKIDRHWHIGQGHLGIDTFLNILSNGDVDHLSFIMETPKMGKMDEENMKTIKSLLSSLKFHSLS